MEALKAVAFTPVSGFAKRSGHRKNPSPTSICRFKNKAFSSSNNSEGHLSVSGYLPGCSVLLSSLLSSGFAKALSYEEALQQSVSGGGFSPDFQLSGVLDSVLGFVAENPIIVGSGVAVLAVPLVVSQLFSNPKPWGVESSKTAYAKLGNDSNAQLLDIRTSLEVKQSGSPDIRGLNKKPVAIAYKGEDKPGFLKKLSLKFKNPENTTLFILDKFDGNSELVAELVTANGFKAAYAIRDGAEGPRGWKNSGLPFILPKKTSFDLSSLTDAFGGGFVDGSDTVPLILGVAVVAALGALAFAEVETILQVLGSVGLIQLVSTKLLFAEDRKQTVQQIEEFVDTKIAAKELVDDIQRIGNALLPFPETTKALPAPTEVTTAPADSTVQKPESATEVNSVPVNSVPKSEIEEESLPGISRPLSPFPNYPDYKPPTSPMPSQP
ncbi:rhodanese-like domain-containing protein 4, chloroplastic [Primulina huaijiensis]|uniref:rhodanese-like domain-containing protein 4, chloroplastic n=1 Tax=Primulina huaijiensis TaxID=1492673 RepID=UPI003CC6DE81